MTAIAATGGQPVPYRYSTSLVPPSLRMSYWNDLSCRLFGSGKVKISARSQDPFEGEMIRLPLHDCEIVSVRCAPVSLHAVPRPANPRTEYSFALDVLCSGQGRISVNGRNMPFGPGDILLTDSSASNYFCFDEPVHVLIVLLSARRFGLRRDLRSHLNRCIRAEEGGPGMLSRFLRHSWRDMQQQVAAPSRAALSEILWNLIQLAFPGKEATAASAARRSTRLEAACDVIERELSNPDFGVKDVARALQISPRYVQCLFREMQTTPTHYLLERRLDLAAARLRSDPRTRITDVALEVGFNDVTYFSRVFHERFLVSARDYRAKFELL